MEVYLKQEPNDTATYHILLTDLSQINKCYDVFKKGKMLTCCSVLDEVKKHIDAPSNTKSDCRHEQTQSDIHQASALNFTDMPAHVTLLPPVGGEINWKK